MEESKEIIIKGNQEVYINSTNETSETDDLDCRPLKVSVKDNGRENHNHISHIKYERTNKRTEY